MSKYIPTVIITGATRGLGNSIFNKFISHGISCIGVGSSTNSTTTLIDQLQKLKNNNFDQLKYDAIKFSKLNQKIAVCAIDLSNWPNWVESKIYPTYIFSKDELGNSKTTNYYNNKPIYTYYPLFPPPFNSDIHGSSTKNHYYIAGVINCAGITQSSLSISTSNLQIKNLININLNSPISLINSYLKYFIKNKRKIGLNSNMIKPFIINVSSCLAQSNSNNKDKNFNISGTSIYSATKSGLSRYSEILDLEVNDKLGISVHCIEPLLIEDTDMTKGLSIHENPIILNDAEKNITTKNSVTNQVWDMFIGQLKC
ncbi:hypothetical protein TBLA_0G01850 [Henningerozyma blattae CBS 6284]|uniref:Ketoreductase (KR) domain-containing protein n=1 Tax=Henningerozyma blattae (strain ATCC 34711 / CBS 6284 / DSM 70876 / NBRC 10599 / NRRL Y-10934 / UCD 77-7) TaxID=1071380 RepID=I2H6X6_HENB6|nr:hypothetical protein TBLA_0G01850 [Tetrapisispora blattae CBS 6284]CCH62128.1 hypothetical protein TBLA_0G01850 [Tetrapisispora blattae CBS 6284]